MREIDRAMDQFPSNALFKRVCRSGLSVVRPLRAEARDFDSFGWNYGSVSGPSYWLYGRLRALLTMNLGLRYRPKRVLEIAAGDAALSACLASELGCDVIANDLRPDHLEGSIALFRNRDKITALPGNLFDLKPASTGLFDLVVACEVIEHVAHTQEFLEHVRKFLAPKGRLLLTTPNGSYFRNKLPTHSDITDFTALEAGQFKPDADGHQFLITLSEMRNLTHKAGLEVENVLLWGTPFITGEFGFRRLGVLPLPFYAIERLCQQLWTGAQERICNNMMLTLKKI
jgi:2-polyprenyl-3-methyl-5-hydroxy-6-metoxy-1,4-benzoquinol methylase